MVPRVSGLDAVVCHDQQYVKSMDIILLFSHVPISSDAVGLLVCMATKIYLSHVGP